MTEPNSRLQSETAGACTCDWNPSTYRRSQTDPGCSIHGGGGQPRDQPPSESVLATSMVPSAGAREEKLRIVAGNIYTRFHPDQLCDCGNRGKTDIASEHFGKCLYRRLWDALRVVPND